MLKFATVLLQSKKTYLGQKYIIDIQKNHCITLFQDDVTILKKKKKIQK